MPADRRIEYRVVNGKGLHIRDAATPIIARSIVQSCLPAVNARVQQRTITIGPWTDVEGDRDA
jgi:hypothetical protein